MSRLTQVLNEGPHPVIDDLDERTELRLLGAARPVLATPGIAGFAAVTAAFGIGIAIEEAADG